MNVSGGKLSPGGPWRQQTGEQLLAGVHGPPRLPPQMLPGPHLPPSTSGNTLLGFPSGLLPLLASPFLKWHYHPGEPPGLQISKFSATLSAASSAISNLSSRSAVPWKCHSNAPLPCCQCPQPSSPLWALTHRPAQEAPHPPSPRQPVNLFSLAFKVLLNC